MKKLKQKQGLTLMEMLAAIVVLVFLTVGINTAMNSSVRVYADSIYQSDSSTLSGILNTSISDILRYASVQTPNDSEIINRGFARDGQFKDNHDQLFSTSVLNCVFTNVKYGAQYAYLAQSDPDEDGRSRIHIRTLKADEPIEFLNLGAFPDLTVSDFSWAYTEGCFEIRYKIVSIKDESKSTDFLLYVQPMND